MRFARSLVRGLQHAVPAGRGVTILCYHLVEAGTSSPVDLPAELFRRQMEELAASARVLALHDAVAELGSGEIPERTAALTFDDAYANFAEEVWPVLEELGLPATLFVPVGFLERTSGAPMAVAEDLPPITWERLRELAHSGLLTIGAHSLTHPDLRRFSDQELERELALSRRRLEERLEIEVDTFCYPRALWNRRVEAAVGRHYRLAAIGGGRLLTPANFRPLRLWRTSIRRDGPVSLAPILSSRLWLEEWLADLWRRSPWRA